MSEEQCKILIAFFCGGIFTLSLQFWLKELIKWLGKRK